MSATLTFHCRAYATAFTTAWGRFSLRGHDMSATAADGSTSVTVHDVSADEKEWIDAYVHAATV